MKKNTDKKQTLFLLLLLISNMITYTVGSLNQASLPKGPEYLRADYVHLKIQGQLLTTFEWLKEVHVQIRGRRIHALLIDQQDEEITLYTHEKNIPVLSLERNYKVLPFSLTSPTKIARRKNYEIVIP